MTEVLFGFSKSRKGLAIFGWLISFFQRNKYSHTFIRLWIPNQSLYVVIDATSHGVRVRHWNQFKEESEMVCAYTAAIDEAKALRLFWWAIERTGQPYPLFEILGNAIQIIVKTISFNKIIISNPFREGSKKPRCNELVALALMEVFSVHISDDLDSVDLIWLEQFIKKKIPWLNPVAMDSQLIN